MLAITQQTEDQGGRKTVHVECDCGKSFDHDERNFLVRCKCGAMESVETLLEDFHLKTRRVE